MRGTMADRMSAVACVWWGFALLVAVVTVALAQPAHPQIPLAFFAGVIDVSVEDAFTPSVGIGYWNGQQTHNWGDPSWDIESYSYLTNGTTYTIQNGQCTLKRNVTDMTIWNPFGDFNTLAKPVIGKSCTSKLGVTGQLYTYSKDLLFYFSLCTSSDGTVPYYFSVESAGVELVREDVVQFIPGAHRGNFNLPFICWKAQ
eukprot:TRINITY_DN8414_c0_g1_i1.p1 TRINITY_DN8414_c0_g1~~TRINITY_DN8414_c0_g1_i1.p1  ORF type:complete len:200 (+),score=25.58 TRINITY_DN8414_c0_g1_i1:120-719(+)